jgi:hypothetical protein
MIFANRDGHPALPRTPGDSGHDAPLAASPRISMRPSRLDYMGRSTFEALLSDADYSPGLPVRGSDIYQPQQMSE